MSRYQSLLDWIAEQRQPMTERVWAWAEVNSGSHNLSGLEQLANTFAELFAPLGGTTEHLPLSPLESIAADGSLSRQPAGRLLRISRRPEARRKVLLLGHMDTVYPPDGPFQRCRQLDANTLEGPGVADMKGGIAVMHTALQALEHSPWAEDLGWEVLLTPDEELGSPGSAPHLAQAAVRVDLGLVFEPPLADGHLVGARKGSGDYTALVRGRSAHAGREPEQGRNAVTALAALISELDAINGKRAGVTVNVARLEGGAPNNVVPDLALCRFNARVSSAADQAWFAAQLQHCAARINRRDGISVQLHGGFHRPAKPISAEFSTWFEHLAQCGAELGQRIAHRPTGGCCDGNNLAAAGLANIDTMGVRGGNLHGVGEYICLDSLTEKAQLAALLLLKLAAGDVPWPVRRQSCASPD